MIQTSDTQLSVTRQFTASAERVFDAFLDPSKAGQFMFATATGKMVRVDIDARVGGSYAFVDRRDGEDVEHVGEYLEINRPRRLVFPSLGALLRKGPSFSKLPGGDSTLPTPPKRQLRVARDSAPTRLHCALVSLSWPILNVTSRVDASHRRS